VRNFPFLPVSELLVFKILSAAEVFLFEEETLYAATGFSDIINCHIFQLLFLYLTSSSQGRLVFHFFK
jgi:hypothetical protein